MNPKTFLRILVTGFWLLLLLPWPAVSKPTAEEVRAFLEKKTSSADSWESAASEPGTSTIRGVNFTQEFGSDFSDLDLSGLHFRYAIFRNANFSGTNLANCEFTCCFLNGSRFENTNLKGTTFGQSDLSRSIFRNVSLTDSRFWSCKFLESQFSGLTAARSEFTYPQMAGANLRGIDFSEAIFWSGSFENANLEDANFSGLQLRWANFQAANLKNTDFSDANLVETCFQNTDLTTTKLDGAALWGADFSHSNARFYERFRAARPLKITIQNFWEIGNLLLLPALAVFLFLMGIWSVRIFLAPFRTSLLHVGAVLNLALILSACCPFWLLLNGGAPIAQMSHFSVWHTWFHFFPILFSATFFIFVTALVLNGTQLARRLRKKRTESCQKLGVFLPLTLIHALLVLCWLFRFVPDA